MQHKLVSTSKKAEFIKTIDSLNAEPIRHEIDVLERLRGMVKCYEKGDALDGLAY